MTQLRIHFFCFAEIFYIMSRTFFLILLLSLANTVFSQTGRINGKVINASSGQALVGATLVLIDKSRTTTTDQNGVFSFNKLPAGIYSVKCTYAGHVDKLIEEITVVDNEVTMLNISLEEKKSDAVVVSATRIKAAGESVASLLIAQKNNAGVSDGITAESIRKTPDKSTSDVLKRVSGASIQDDRFAIIRGLNDRYNAAFINGAPLPSTESDRKAFAFDIFPSSILDNLVIYKTATPDKSAEFAGGLIDITTKSIPAKNFMAISFGGAFNTSITGKTRYYSANRGKKDWLGIDDGSRSIPNAVPGVKELKNLTFQERAELAKLFKDYKWGINAGNTSPSFSFQFSKGFTFERKQKEFIGALFSATYNKTFSFYEGERNSYDFDLTAPQGAQLNQKSKYRDSVYNDETVLALLANISVKINNSNSINWKNNYSINTDNKLAKRIGSPDYTADSTIFIKDATRWYTSNRIFSSQLSGEHQPGKYKTKINWLAAYSEVRRDIPNLARTSYSGIYPDVNFLYANFSFGPPNQTAGMGTMFHANSFENIKSIKVDITQPFTFMKNSQNYVKIGAGYQYRKRDFSSRVLGFAPYDRGVAFDYSLNELPDDQIFLPEHLGVMTNGMGGFMISDGTLANSDYKASSEMIHAYIMDDQRFFKKFRLIFGVRMESFRQKLNSVKNLNDTINLNTTITDFLPSVNFVYSLTSKMNIRLSYSQTINRPEFRELAPFLFYDFVTNYTYEGQESLSRARIDNYDFRYEFFPGKAQLFSVSAFYKKFKDPIEIVTIPNTTSQVIYVNDKSAEVYGAEAEFRTLIGTLAGIKNDKSWLNKLTLSANAAYIKSSVKLDSLFSFPPEQLVTDRALQGQSPYLINTSLGFNDDKLGLSATFSLNRVGDRIAIAGTYRDADIYEKARTIIDFQVAKFFLNKKLELRITARDILAQKISYYFDFDKSKSFTGNDRYFSSNTAPKVFSLNVTYKF